MATTVSLIQMLASGVVHPTTGAILASGVCRFYQPATLTPQTVYSDNAGASAISPPLVLTAGGTGIAYTNNPIRMIIKDATDVTTLYDVNINTAIDESIYVTSPAFNGGVETRLATILDAVDDSFGGTAGFWQIKNGTTERNVKDAIVDLGLNVKEYGATGDGITDDSTSVAAAFTSVLASGRTLYFPAGTYLLSSAAMTVPGATSTVTIRGDGRTTILKGTNATMNMMVGTSTNWTVRDLTISHATASSGIAISSSSATFLDNIWVSGFATSVTGGGVVVGGSLGGISTAGGTWRLFGTTAGTVSGATTFAAQTVSSAFTLFATTTTDMANGGNTTPTIGGTGQPVAYQRIRGTSAGGGTVNASATPAGTLFLVLDCFNNSGGAFLFTLNAQYHATANPNPANGTRRLVAFAWNTTESAWFEFARSAADVT